MSEQLNVGSVASSARRSKHVFTHPSRQALLARQPWFLNSMWSGLLALFTIAGPAVATDWYSFAANTSATSFLEIDRDSMRRAGRLGFALERYSISKPPWPVADSDFPPWQRLEGTARYDCIAHTRQWINFSTFTYASDKVANKKEKGPSPAVAVLDQSDDAKAMQMICASKTTGP